MKVTFIFLTYICTVYSYIFYGDLVEEWNNFKIKYNKTYESDSEDGFRSLTYFLNRAKIDNHNFKYQTGEVTYFLAMNQFGDMTSDEFAKKMNGFKKSNHIDDINESVSATFIEPANVQLPDEVDWRKIGAVTPVKNQGDCGSCWAFSATGSLEGQHFRHNDTLISLSEQNLIDCSGRFGNSGCKGGLINSAFTYIKVNRGIDTEKSYPYKAKDDRCRYISKNSGADDKGYVNIPSGSEDKLQAAVATVGPISVAIDAENFSFQFYKGGIYYDPFCSSDYLNHGVLAIGYGTDKATGKDFWLVKNSWGTTWGEDGYIRMSRNRHNNCGIASSASYPLV